MDLTDVTVQDAHAVKTECVPVMVSHTSALVVDMEPMECVPVVACQVMDITCMDMATMEWEVI